MFLQWGPVDPELDVVELPEAFRKVIFLHWIMKVTLLLFMLAELSFRTGAGSFTFLIPQACKITVRCLDTHVLAVLFAAALLYDKLKESTSISLLAPVFVAKVPIISAIFSACVAFDFFFNL